MVEIGPELLEPGQGVADRLGELGLAGDARQLGLEPGLERVEDRCGVRLPEFDALLGWLAAGLFLDGVEPGDALDGLLGDRRCLALDDVDELAPDMRQAGDLAAAP